jgi:phosphopantetheine adenylyltransferase
MNQPPDHPRRQELRQKRADLHGKRRRLHERLSEVCEDFVLEDLTREHKQKALVRELRYLLDYYREEESWKGVE